MNEIKGDIPAMLSWEGANTPKAKNTMGKDDFMKLLMTQLKYQDPMKPMDHEQFAAQLAQFGSLEQLSNIGSGIQNLKTSLGDGQKLQALGMIGKDIKASSNDIDFKGEAVTIPRPTSKDLTPVKATIFDVDGNMVREIDLAGTKPEEGIRWDGKNTDGGQVNPGKYVYRVHGADGNGQQREIGTELSGTVTGVQMEGAIPTLLVKTGGATQKIEMSKIQTVVTPDAHAAPAPTPGTAAPAPAIPVTVAPKPSQSIPIEGTSDDSGKSPARGLDLAALMGGNRQ